ncbi:MAG: hypothetical protein M1830_010043 [Pleopsidium flavum]|nr:MAG: hypothetical protein M1830_010043 [Pleopsidium flavum]
MTHASRPLPLSSVDLAWREGVLCADSAVRSRYTAYLDSVNQQQRWTASRQSDLLGCALLKLPNIHHVIFTATWLTTETFDEWSTGRGGLLLGLDPVHQAPVGDHLSELMPVLGTSHKKIKSLTIEINGQVTITNRTRYFFQHIENFTILGKGRPWCKRWCFWSRSSSCMTERLRQRNLSVSIGQAQRSHTADTSRKGKGGATGEDLLSIKLESEEQEALKRVGQGGSFCALEPWMGRGRATFPGHTANR